MLRKLLIFIMMTVPCLSSAHHSSSRYDMSRQVEIQGTVARVEWSNPHVYFFVRREDGSSVIEWEVENHPPAMMRRMGWTKNTLRVGDQVSVAGNPTRLEESRGIYPVSIKKNEVVLYQSGDFTRLSEPKVMSSEGADGLNGVWETMVSLPLILSFYNPDHALTEAGRLALESYDETTMLPGLNCIPYSSPLLMIDPDFKSIEVADDLIEITSGYAGAVRRIYLDGNSRESSVPSLQGRSMGRWEDDRTLVIDTDLFADHRTANGYRGVPSGSRKHLVERFRLSEDGKTLQYQFELTDPQYLAAPVRGEVQWVYRPDVEYSYEPCILENARRFLE